MSEQNFDLVIRGGQAVMPSGIVSADIGIVGERIVSIGDLACAKASATFEARGLHVLPGVIDTHVHFREPGHLEKEDMETGSRAALLGGVTAVFEMPNTNPPTTTRETIADKLKRAEARMQCDYAFYVGATAENAASLGELEMLPGVAGVKAFLGSSTGSLLLDKEPDIIAALKSGKRRMAVHSEDEARLKERAKLAMPGDPSTHPIWRDVETAVRSTTRILGLAREAKRRLHVLHVTSAEELPLLAEARAFATVEAAVPHLTLAAPDCYRRLGAYAQINPPIREARHRDALWQAVREGLIDTLGSDHAPHTRQDKEGIYPQTASGLTGVQTLVTIMLDHVNSGRLSLERFADIASAGPARVFGIANKGRIARGYDADFTIVDMAARRRIENAQIASRCGWTPYDGMTTIGWPVATILRGRVVMRDGALEAASKGRPLDFLEVNAAPAA
jgi:dihydroorotase